MEYWSDGVLECWSVGVLECWSESPDQDFVPKGLKDSAWGFNPRS